MSQEQRFKSLAEEQKEQEWIARILDPRMRASWLARLVCFLYDCIYLFLIIFLTSVFTTIWMLISAQPPYDLELFEIRQYLLDNHPEMFVIDRIIKVIVAILYFLVPAFTRNPRTLGMVSFGVSLMNDQGDDISAKQYLKRECLRWLLFPGFFLALGPEKRALHDRLTNTYVVLN